ncbi:MAG TPA: right-handed parallel beta-helix repeat-containing protein [Baekduia sp.]|jgi:parallel beta-helix repeat protein
MRHALAVAGLVLAVAALAGCGTQRAPAAQQARSASPACDLVASPTGSDHAAGTVAAPLRTPQRLLARLRAGQVGCLRGGTYVQDVRVGRSHITLTSFARERAKIVGRLWVQRQAHDDTISGLLLDGRNPRRYPSPTVNGDHITFVENHVTNGRTGICFDLGGVAGYGIAQHTLLLRNRIHGCGALPASNRQHGIYIEHTLDTRIVDNVIYDNADRGIQLYPDAQRTTITGNVIDGNGEGIIFSGDGATASNHTTVQRNLVTNARIRADVESWYPGRLRGTANVVRDNCLWGGRATVDPSEGGFVATDNVVADPGYRDRRAGDFRLAPGSPCAALLARSTAPAGPAGETPASVG